jgi:signal peptidase II
MAEPSPVPPKPGLFRGKLWFWVPIAPLVAFDLWSKAASFAFLEKLPGSPMGREHVIWDTTPLRFSFVTWWNKGTIWGLGQDFTGALMVLRCLALLLIVYFARRLSPVAKLQQLVLGMIMAGAIGNLYDNFTQERSGVRDFLRFQGNFFGSHWEFPAFNVADSCICVGAISLAIMLWRGTEEHVAAELKKQAE